MSDGFSVAVFRPEHSLDSWACELRKHGFVKRVPESMLSEDDAESAGILAAVKLSKEVESRLEPLGQRERDRIREADRHASELKEGQKLENVSDLMWYKRYISILEASWASVSRAWEPGAWKSLQKAKPAEEQASDADAEPGPQARAAPALPAANERAGPMPAIISAQRANGAGEPGAAAQENGEHVLDKAGIAALMRREKLLRFLADKEKKKDDEAGQKKEGAQ